MNDRVRITVAGGVADVRLTRADKLNALDGAMFDGIIAAIDELGTMTASAPPSSRARAARFRIAHPATRFAIRETY